MKANKDRKLSSWRDDDGTIIIEEQTAYIPQGYQRRKWGVHRVALTTEELAQIASKHTHVDN